MSQVAGTNFQPIVLWKTVRLLVLPKVRGKWPWWVWDSYFLPFLTFFVCLFLKSRAIALEAQNTRWRKTLRWGYGYQVGNVLSCLWWWLNGWKYIKLLWLTCKSYLCEVYTFLSSALSSGTFWLLNTSSNKIIMCSACVFLRQTLTFSSGSSSSYRHCCGIDVACPERLIVRDWSGGGSSWRSEGEVLPWGFMVVLLRSLPYIPQEDYCRRSKTGHSWSLAFCLSVWFHCPPYLTIIAFMARHLTEDKLMRTPHPQTSSPPNPELNKPGIIVPSPQLPTIKS